MTTEQLTLKSFEYGHLRGHIIRAKGGHHDYGYAVRPHDGKGWLVYTPASNDGDWLMAMWKRYRDGGWLNTNEAHVATLAEAKAYAYARSLTPVLS